MNPSRDDSSTTPFVATPEVQHKWLALTPVVFVLLWSTGFIGAKFGLPFAEPFTFLAIRFTFVACALAACCLVTRTHWPQDPVQWLHLCVVGVLVHGVYLGGVFASIHQGVGAGLSALITGIQPILTASLVGLLLGERVIARTWLGLIAGFTGVILVVGNSVVWSTSTTLGVGYSFAALVGLSIGVIYQKRFCQTMSLLSGSCVQFCAAAILCIVVSVTFETRQINWTPEFWFALGWLVIVLSLGAMTLLWILVRQGAATQVSSLFYLVPGVVAVEAWLLFDETLSPMALLGFAIAALGVWQVNRATHDSN